MNSPKMEDASEDLLRQTELICQQDRFRETLLRHLDISQSGLEHAQLVMDIHPDDQMLLHSLHHHQSAEMALSQYFSISLQQFNAARQIMQACFGSQLEHIKVLDFACGYGRLLRFMTMLVPAENIWASEIQPEALTFTRASFGVQGILSTPDPQDFVVDERFDFIWVASLFSHLPDTLFQDWLAKLCSLLTPRGVLCFSVRGSELLPAGEVLPESGILYQRASELTPLDADIYGTAYVSESYVRGCIDKQLGFGHGYARLPRALANEQDLYLLGRQPDRELPGADDFDKGLWGWVDRISLHDKRTLNMEGWAASMDKQALDHVEVSVDGDASRVQADIERPDVATAFAQPDLLKSGWAFTQKLAAASDAPYVEVSAHSVGGGSFLLFAGAVKRSGKSSRLNKRALGITLLLAVLMLVWLFGIREVPESPKQGQKQELELEQPGHPATIRGLQLPLLNDADYDWIAARIFENEAASQVRYLTFWGEGEDFPSFGIGHFIWFPAGVDAPFDEQFPDMVAYVSQRAATVQPFPQWMQNLAPFDAPWRSKAAFDQAWSSDEMTALREWLQATARWQARYIVATFEQRWQSLEMPPDKKLQLTVLLQQLANSASGLFAIIDYYNFKGLGVNPRERYQGQGWGLIQVLQAMPAYSAAPSGPQTGSAAAGDADLLEQFSVAAAQRLSLRVELAPPERNESRWLPGWLMRLQGYLPVGEPVTE